MSRTSALAYEYSGIMGDDDDVMVEASTVCRILVIEDNRSDVLLIKRMLRDAVMEHTLEFADVPRMIDALDLLDREVFDLVLLDLNLLDIEGTASVAALHAEAPNIPIIVYSGADDAQLKQEALICGAKHFLVKGKESPYGLKFMIQNTLTHASC